MPIRLVLAFTVIALAAIQAAVAQQAPNAPAPGAPKNPTETVVPAEAKPAAAPAEKALQTATGFVFHDKNGDGRRNEGEPGVPGVRVSNGRDVVPTDATGKYSLPVDDDTMLFVVKPRNWMTPVDGDNLPKFYYNHKPAGSPKVHFPSVAPTGPLPASVDFALVPREEPDSFKLLLFGDTQPRDVKEVEYITHDVIEPLITAGKHGAVLGITLGDVVFNDLSVYPPLIKSVGLLGLPWYNVLGNHDMNFDGTEDRYSDETWEHYFGPSYYSYNHGPVHFIALDDVIWVPADPKDKKAKGKYHGGLGAKQMEWLRNDLASIPNDQLVVLTMHIPITEIEERPEIYKLLAARPHSLSISAHTHTQAHKFLGSEEGFPGGGKHHHLIHATVCGSWWSGAPDENGIPNATMSDGAPNGYSIVTFNGPNYDVEFHAARRPADHQMNIYTPEEVAVEAVPTTDVVVNVFAGSEREKVEYRLGESGEWRTMEQARGEDPYFVAMKKLEEGPTPPPGRKLPAAHKSTHLWRAKLATAAPTPGTYLVHVRATDMFGKTHVDQRAVRIVAASPSTPAPATTPAAGN
ncbi:calcineurin-like phosphoesterase C-terminal domain-containing protein [Paludisphaera rhizosphaerae]|uniref:calcineurin-like phosphoesterase C-terminal domain-containing protein n=1 Tax=Paludisphaera rhizosphaerae TaxID=2711216 RepID=UPI0013EE0D78|nr:calcineurin-like phosphoesterase family protein [Paludisphaera rhizosphaerae]